MASTFSGRVAAEIIAFASEQDANQENLTELLGMQGTDIRQESVRIPCAQVARMWDAAIEQTGDEFLALHLAEAQNLAASRTTSLIMEASSTVWEAFELAAKYSVLIADAMAVSIGEENDTTWIQFTHNFDWAQQPQRVIRDCLNITYLSAVQSVQRLTGYSHPPTLLTFTSPRPEQVVEYYRVFNCSVQFDAPFNRIGFPKDLSEQSVVTGDAGLKELLKHYANEQIERFRSGGTVANDVLREIFDRMSPVPPTLSMVATVLGMSDRSLQRRLKLEGETYKQLVERARMTLSEKYLLDPDRSIDEVAYVSGYADSSSFVRAFRRWHGESPREYSMKVKS